MPTYEDRKITGASIFGLELARFEDGLSVHGTVRIQLSRYDGDENGPAITVDAGAPIHPAPTIPEAERVLLEAALGVLGRAHSATTDELLKLLPSAYQPPKPV